MDNLTPQERYRIKHGLMCKTYKLPKEIVEQFANVCKDRGEAQSKVLQRYMQGYINSK